MSGGMSGHTSPVNQTPIWLTPPHVLDALGPFDLDPCAVSEPRPWPTAAHHYTVEDDGLSKPWFGRVFMNPPYGGPAIVRPWLRRMVDHGRGIALIFARTETEAFFDFVWRAGTAALFLEGRLTFHYPDGVDPEQCRRHTHTWTVRDPDKPTIQWCSNCGLASANGGAPSVLITYGEEDAEILRTCGLPGAWVDLTRVAGRPVHDPVLEALG
jgi:hypothetical protein